MATNNWLEIDLKGFAQILRNKGIARIALEPISNAFDTEATEIQVTFNQSGGKATLFVKDDDPNGFADLRDAYMLFAPSKRREDPTKRGRFGQGDKELIAICYNGGEVEVESTTGTVTFTQAGRTNSRRSTKEGTTLTAHFRCNKDEAREFEDLVGQLIVPEGVKLTFNGMVYLRPTPVKVVREALATVNIDADGNLAPTKRVTDIELYEAEGTPYIYELGVPVVEHDGRFHINVMQKVPLNTARDNVTPAYLRRLREIMLNETHEMLTSVDMKKGWVRDALPTASPEAIKSHMTKVHGANAVIYDPSDTEAVKRLQDKGYKVIHGNQYDTATWSRVREHEILLPAGRVMPTGVPTSPDGVPPIPVEDWTYEMAHFARYVEQLGGHLLGFAPTVAFHKVRLKGTAHTSAWYGGRTITFNLHYLGMAWPGNVSQEAADALIIHELSHEGTGQDHFTDRYIHKLAELGAKLRSCKAVLR